MKILVSFLFSLLCVTGFSQELELDFAHRYGQISDGLEHSVNFTEFYDEFNVWVVAGTFESSVNVGINSNAILTSEDEERMSFVAIYNEDFDLLNHFKLEGGVVSAAYTENEIILTGGFRDIVDFDINDESNELIGSQSVQANGYLASYTHQGSLNWVNTFGSLSSNRGTFCSIYNNEIILINAFSGNQSGVPFSFVQDDLEVLVESDNGPSTILFRFDLEGDYQFHHNFYSEGGWVIPNDHHRKDNLLYLSLRLQSGNFNAGITETINFNYTAVNNNLVFGLDLNNYELLEYYSFKAVDNNSGVSGTFIDTNSSSDNILFSSFGLVGTIEVSTDINNEELNFTAFTGISSGLAILANQNDGFQSSATFTTDDAILISGCSLLENGDGIIAVSYRSNVFFNSTLVAENSENDDLISTLLYLNSQMNGMAIFEFDSFQGDLNHYIIKGSNLGELIIAGSYRGNHDVDFTENYLGLGNVSDDRAGFIAKYTFDPTTSIKEQPEAPKLTVYPNPAANTLFFSEYLEPNANVQIYSAEGKLVKTVVVSQNGLDVSDLANGQYSLLLDGVSVSTFVVNR